jgi:electron transport complex protein RnfB
MFIDVLIAVAVVFVIAALMGLLLAVADKFLYVAVDERITKVTEMLPNANCGGCGYPGCSGLAEALVEGKVKKVSTCRPSKPEARQAIKDYLDVTPGPDGSTINVKL